MDKGVVKRVIVTPDKHFPLHDQPAINCLKKTIEKVKPEAYVDLGDFQKAAYFRQMFHRVTSQHPLRKSGVRTLSVPRL